MLILGLKSYENGSLHFLFLGTLALRMQPPWYEEAQATLWRGPYREEPTASTNFASHVNEPFWNLVLQPQLNHPKRCHVEER